MSRDRATDSCLKFSTDPIPEFQQYPLPSIEEELLKSARENETEKIKELIGQRASPNHKDHDGNTPIIHMARHKSPDMVSLLINNGGVLSINWTNNEKQTALMCSAKAGDVDSLRLLLDSGAEVDFQVHVVKTVPLKSAVFCY